MASEKKKVFPKEILDLSTKTGISPEDLIRQAVREPNKFAGLAAGAGVSPPKLADATKNGAKAKVEEKKYRIPKIGEQLSRFGQDPNAPPMPKEMGNPPFKEQPGTGGGLSGQKEGIGGGALRDLWAWLNEERFPPGYGAGAPKVAANAGVTNTGVASAPIGPDASGLMVNTGDRGPAKTIDGQAPTPPPAAPTPVGYGPGAAPSNNPESPGSAAARAASASAETANGPAATPTDDLTKLAIGKALSGVKAPAPPNPLPGAGAHAPGSGSIPQTSTDDVLRSLAVIMQSRKRPSLKEAV